MTTTYYGKPRRAYRLGQKLAEGGEGSIYLVQGQPSLVAKIYTPRRRPPEEKLAWMVANPPEDPTLASQGHISIAWPQALLYDDRGEFAGFLMPFIRDTIPLLRVFTPKLRRQWAPNFSWRYLHRTARNFASTLSAIHARDYVVGDINDGNVVVSTNALITILDTDSFQVTARAQGAPHVFPCPVGVEEYTAGELQGIAFETQVRTPHHDTFALAVLTFKLLMDGNHPFKSLWTDTGSEPLSISMKIVNGLFPYQTPALSNVAPPKNAPGFEVLHPEIAFLFQRCFIDGHKNPARRPIADDWTRALEVAEQALVDCPHGHVYSSHLRSCPYCAGPASGAARRTQLPLPTLTMPAAATSPARSATWPQPAPPVPAPPVTSRTSSAIFAPSPTQATAPAPPVAKRRRPIVYAGAGAALAAVILFATVLNGGGDSSPAPSAAVIASTVTATAVPTLVPTSTESPPTPTPGPDLLAGGCWTADQLVASSGVDGSTPQWETPPNQVLEAGTRYIATIVTDQGTIEVELLADEAPVSVNNFVCLARAGYFDGTSFHRIEPNSVLQAGDPSGTGDGGPGYRFTDTAVSGNYDRGMLAMVNTGPDTNGSQFIIFLSDHSARLPKRYTTFGQIVGGMDVADAIGASAPIGGTLDAQPIIQQVIISELDDNSGS